MVNIDDVYIVQYNSTFGWVNKIAFPTKDLAQEYIEQHGEDTDSGGEPIRYCIDRIRFEESL